MPFSKTYKTNLLAIIFVAVVPVIIFSRLLKIISPHEAAYTCWFFGILILRTIIVFYLIKVIIKRFHKNYIIAKRPERLTNRALLKSSLLILFLLLEIVFQYVPQNQDVYSLGLATKVWNACYKKSENEKGLRDKSLKNRINNTKQKVFFLGDSFTYGNGIKKTEDRFSDRVSGRIDSAKFETFNLGKGNSDTKDEFLRLVNFDAKPNYLILQYYHNDIEKIGSKYGYFNLDNTGYKVKKTSGLKRVMSAIGLFPLRVSFFINYIALNNSKFLIPKSQKSYKECVTKAYSDTACLNEHLKDFRAIINYCSVNHTRLYVLFIPDVRDITYTQEIFDTHIIPFLNKHHIKYITVNDELRKYTTEELVVNPLNAHTNPFANAIIAQRILDSISEFKR